MDADGLAPGVDREWSAKIFDFKCSMFMMF